MAFEVVITDEAFRNLDTILGFIKRQASVEIARKWFSAVIAAIESLGEMPARCPLAPEAAELGDDVRVLLCGRRNRTYKIYFKIHRNVESRDSVQVFHVRHWAQKHAERDELEDLMDDFDNFESEE